VSWGVETLDGGCKRLRSCLTCPLVHRQKVKKRKPHTHSTAGHAVAENRCDTGLFGGQQGHAGRHLSGAIRYFNQDVVVRLLSWASRNDLTFL